MSLMISSESCSRSTLIKAGIASFTNSKGGSGFPLHKLANVHELFLMKLCGSPYLYNSYEIGLTIPVYIMASLMRVLSIAMLPRHQMACSMTSI